MNVFLSVGTVVGVAQSTPALRSVIKTVTKNDCLGRVMVMVTYRARNIV